MLFIKWDDVDYGLWVVEYGYLIVMLFGVVIWYMVWSDKDDVIDW